MLLLNIMKIKDHWTRNRESTDDSVTYLYSCVALEDLLTSAVLSDLIYVTGFAYRFCQNISSLQYNLLQCLAKRVGSPLQVENEDGDGQDDEGILKFFLGKGYKTTVVKVGRIKLYSKYSKGLGVKS